MPFDPVDFPGTSEYMERRIELLARRAYLLDPDNFDADEFLEDFYPDEDD